MEGEKHDKGGIVIKTSDYHSSCYPHYNSNYNSSYDHLYGIANEVIIDTTDL